MKILLVQPPHYYGKHSRPPQAFPLGIGYIAAALRKNGHAIEVLDIYAHQYPDDEVGRRIKAMPDDIDAVCVSAMSTQYRYVKWLIGRLKEKRDIPVIVGNALATFSAHVLLKNSGADICVNGEGERTIVDLLENLSSPEKVDGIYYLSKGEMKGTPDRPYTIDIDTIEPPDRDIFPMQIYLDNCYLWGSPEMKAINIITARGCPFSCNFCSKTFSGIRLRTIASVIREIESLRERYDFGAVSFNDELTLVNKERVYELCKYFKRTGLKWVCQGRVDKVDADLLKCMKGSGCIALGFGVESGSQRILDRMNKGIKVKQAVDAIRAAEKAGIRPIIQMMYGYIGEDDESLSDTVRFFNKIHFPTMQFSMTTALPGTRLYAEASGSGLIKNEDEYMEKLDWGYYGEREALINFTRFADDALAAKRIETERLINLNYRRYLATHPWVALKILLRKTASYYKRYGFLKTMAKAARSKSYLKKESWMV